MLFILAHDRPPFPGPLSFLVLCPLLPPTTVPEIFPLCSPLTFRNALYFLALTGTRLSCEDTTRPEALFLFLLFSVFWTLDMEMGRCPPDAPLLSFRTFGFPPFPKAHLPSLHNQVVLWYLQLVFSFDFSIGWWSLHHYSLSLARGKFFLSSLSSVPLDLVLHPSTVINSRVILRSSHSQCPQVPLRLSFLHLTTWLVVLIFLDYSL